MSMATTGIIRPVVGGAVALVIILAGYLGFVVEDSSIYIMVYNDRDSDIMLSNFMAEIYDPDGKKVGQLEMQSSTTIPADSIVKLPLGTTQIHEMRSYKKYETFAISCSWEANGIIYNKILYQRYGDLTEITLVL